jgi:riboflavin kinase/FMN adenylyltransferase
MQLVHGHRALGRALRRPAVGIGNFDGVHRGHQRLFEEVRRRAAALGGESAIFTFQPHPAKVLAPQLAPALITTPERKLELIAEAGIDVTVVEPFDHAFAAVTAERFVEEVLVGALGVAEVCVGYNFTFGKGRGGDARTLEELGRRRGFAVDVIEPITVDGIVCSSTKVREFVLAGRVDGASLLLGRDFEVDGTVERGAGRGRQIGVPTANLVAATELLPRTGVYAGWAELPSGARFDAAINLGTNPTFGASGLHLEAHLLDFPVDGSSGDLLGSALRLGFTARLRDERRFASAEELVAQIRRDVEATRSLRAAARAGSVAGDR